MSDRKIRDDVRLGAILIVGEAGLRHWITGLVLALFFCLFPRLGFCASPLVGRINPSSGASQPNRTVNFTASYSDPDGWQNIKGCYFLINTTVNGQNSFYGYYDQNTNKLYLRDNLNQKWQGGVSPSTGKTLENSYAKLNCARTTVSGSANQLSIKWSVSFKSSFVGKKNLYLYVIDDTKAKSPWVKKGVWSIILQPTVDTTPPQITNLNPQDGSTFDENDLVLISPTVNDIDPSPLEYQFSLDGAIKQPWSAQSNYTWKAIPERHSLKVEVKDAGGQDSRESEIYIFRKPLIPADN